MPQNDHVKVIDEKVTELSDELAQLRKGTDLRELIRIIRFPEWPTSAESSVRRLATHRAVDDDILAIRSDLVSLPASRHGPGHIN
jgi:hypothetical protein